MKSKSILPILLLFLCSCSTFQNNRDCVTKTFLSSFLTDSSQSFIALQEVYGHSDCPAYSLAILSDGTLNYCGSQNVKKSGFLQTKISQDETNQLFTYISNQGEINLDNTYLHNDSSGFGSGSTILTVFINNRRDTLFAVAPYPPGLSQILNRIVNTAGIESFIQSYK